MILNKFLPGAVLLQPDFSTFWNMKKDLCEKGILDLRKELSLTRLVLSYKYKSNETIAYRKWLILRILKNLKNHLKSEEWHRQQLFQLFETECAVTRFIGEMAQNNYHGWTHRIWAVQNIVYDYAPEVVVSELEFSYSWIQSHVSEHTGFHYRQYLFRLSKNVDIPEVSIKKYYDVTRRAFKIDSNNKFFLRLLLGESTSAINVFPETSENLRVQNYVCILIYELLCTLRVLYKLYHGHETVWYHRRFVIYHLRQIIHEFSSSSNVQDSNLPESYGKFIENSHQLTDKKFSANGEISSKISKYDNTIVNTSELYKFITESESRLLNKALHCSSSITKQFAEKHRNWLKFMFHLEI